jgi:hypothetical protein
MPPKEPEEPSSWPQYADLISETVEAFKVDFHLSEEVAKAFHRVNKRKAASAEFHANKSAKTPTSPTD